MPKPARLIPTPKSVSHGKAATSHADRASAATRRRVTTSSDTTEHHMLGWPGLRFVPTELPGVVLIEPAAFQDARGFFFEFYRRDRFAAAGLEAEFVQDNHSRSRRGTLRGLHYQHPYDQTKLCRVVVGE